jgi:carbon storage regulator CsrA
MLVLTRKSKEKIIIRGRDGEETIEITILKIQGGKASIGIQAGRQWEVLREELVTEKSNDNSILANSAQ